MVFVAELVGGVEELVDRDENGHERDHDPGQRRADHQHDDQGRHQQRRIDQHVDEALGQQRLDRRDRADAREQVTDMPALEIAERQAQQMADDIAAQLEGERLAEGQDHPVAQRARDGAQRVDRAEADQQDGQQADVALADGLVDHELDEEGRQQGQQLDHQRQDEDLGERAAEVAEPAPQVAEPGGDLGFDRLEGRGRGQLERDPGEMVAELGDRQPARRRRARDDSRDQRVDVASGRVKAPARCPTAASVRFACSDSSRA